MDRWAEKIAVVTGASSGIGEAIVKQLVALKMIVVGLARREDRLMQLKSELGEGEFHFHKCDVSDLASIKCAFEFIKKNFGHVHVLVNNAGLVKDCSILDEGHEEELISLINTNLMGSVFCTKEAYKMMKETGEECHIISINSILGHNIPTLSMPGFNFNLYPSSKFGLKAAMEVIRRELAADKNFRVSNISPGLVKTEISHASGNPMSDRIMSAKEILFPEDIAKTVAFVLEMPKHVQITEMIVTPTGQKH